MKVQAGDKNVEVDQIPDRCPVCLNGIQPIELNQLFLKKEFMEVVFRCPRQDCQRFFIAQYYSYYGTAGGLRAQLRSCVPLTVSVSDVSPVITAISPDFTAIFKQAEEAEKRNLLLVCGPGYRKALEFLIKDYVIRSNREKAEEVKKLLLGACISKYVTSDRVKQVAARAVWLGNDETHYLRKWEGKDLQDLKALIALTVHWIEMEELTEAVMKDMPEGK
jgi:hypothetical protein